MFEPPAEYYEPYYACMLFNYDYILLAELDEAREPTNTTVARMITKPIR